MELEGTIRPGARKISGILTNQQDQGTCYAHVISNSLNLLHYTDINET
jgi:hypothetical protein